MTACRGRVSGPAGAAVKLGLPRQTLTSKIKTLGIDVQRFTMRPGHSRPRQRGRRWETSSAVCSWRMPADVSSHAPAPTALDRCVLLPIRPRARWCRAGVPSIQQLLTIRRPNSCLHTHTSMVYDWSHSCNTSSQQHMRTTRRKTAPYGLLSRQALPPQTLPVLLNIADTDMFHLKE